MTINVFLFIRQMISRSVKIRIQIWGGGNRDTLGEMTKIKIIQIDLSTLRLLKKVSKYYYENNY